MTKRQLRRARTFAIASIGCVLFVVFAQADAQTRMSREEAAQLYAAAGFPIANNQPVNRCGRPAKPRVTFVDINGDKNAEALVIDTDVSCYAPSGRYYAVLVKEGASWRAIAKGNGSVEALPTSTSGWLNMRITDAGCTREHRYDGRTYKPATSCAGEALATAQGTTQRAPAIAQAPTQPGEPRSPRPSTKSVPPPSAATQSAATGAASAATGTKLDANDEVAAFKAAGFKKHGKAWRNCDDPSSGTGAFERVADINGDGLLDAVLVEGGTACYGMTGQGFWVVSKRPDGTWKLLTGGPGVPEFLETKGADGWPDVSVGGPGFCFAVVRWNGKEYKFHRSEYEGKPCKR